MELKIERDERVGAPLHLVWDELGSLDQVLNKTPLIRLHDVGADGRRASAQAELAWGPVSWVVELDVTLLGLVDQRQIRYVIEARKAGARVETTVDLVPLGRNETNLTYRGLVEVRHGTTGRLRRFLNDIAEEQAHRVVQRVKVRAEQRRLAQERLVD